MLLNKVARIYSIIIMFIASNTYFEQLNVTVLRTSLNTLASAFLYKINK